MRLQLCMSCQTAPLIECEEGHHCRRKTHGGLFCAFMQCQGPLRDRVRNQSFAVTICFGHNKQCSQFQAKTSTCRRFSWGHRASQTLSAVSPTACCFLSKFATSSAKAGASLRLRAMLYPVAGCTRFAAAPKAVIGCWATGKGPPTGMKDHSSSCIFLTWSVPTQLT